MLSFNSNRDNMGRKMKATDIQINDLVFVRSKNKIGIVHEIARHSCHVWCGETYGSVYSDRYDYNDIEPIPLTSEILKKNGWKELEWKDVNYHLGVTTAYKTDDYIIQIGYNEAIDKYVIFDGFVSFSYVHQLQHALRFCELDELADEFKIKE